MLHHHHRNRLLFILKYRELGAPGQWNYSCYGGHLSSGLYNSARFVVDMLNDNGIDAKLVTVCDNNDIDREVTKYKPTHVLIEAYWVVPEKFDVLKPLHPKVKWIIRDHSKTEFLAQEGSAFKWTAGYLKRGITVACNSPESYADMVNYAKVLGVDERLVSFLPNYYRLNAPVEKCHVHPYKRYRDTNQIHIGCFGAIRPFKNQVTQAIAALEFATDIKASLQFHINATRIEGGASPMLHNLRGIFGALPQHNLIEHEWVDHEEFLKLIAKMDFTTQVSYSETFNIVSADSVNVGVVVVGSKEIPWMPEGMQADPSSVSDMSATMRHAWLDVHHGRYLALERKGLTQYSERSREIWMQKFNR